MWALGCLLYEMIFGIVPFDNGEGTAPEIFSEVLKYSAGKMRGVRLPLGYRLQSKLHWHTVDFIYCLLSPAYEDRPSTLEAAEHEALQDFPLLQVESKSLEAPHPRRGHDEQKTAHEAPRSKASASSTVAEAGDGEGSQALPLPSNFDIPVEDYDKFVGFLGCSGWDMEQLIEQVGQMQAGHNMLSAGGDREGAPTEGERRRRSSLNLPSENKKKNRNSMNLPGDVPPVKTLQPVKKRDSMR